MRKWGITPMCALFFSLGSVAVQYRASRMSWPNDENRRSATWQHNNRSMSLDERANKLVAPCLYNQSYRYYYCSIICVYLQHVVYDVQFDDRLSPDKVVHHGVIHVAHHRVAQHHNEAFQHVTHLGWLEQAGATTTKTHTQKKCSHQSLQAKADQSRLSSAWAKSDGALLLSRG